ncbi:MAG TPA: zf-HC2 domain-containing protein, partial [Thermoanaerobaculia bacterium]|nr:zf-HC2 domain-containing protein [Thermoanaerobaculia bacterium]
MNGNGHAHPGRSVEFLSRLHDGDLPAGERARFESHRARCAECRRAAIEFEDALRLFRSARSVPPRSDLAARILRKVQSTNRSRAPFPMRFRIDLGWAALLLTALLALLIATPITVRQPAALPAPEAAPATPPPASADRAPAPPRPLAQRKSESPSESRPLGDLRVGENAPAAGDVFSRRSAAQSKEADRSIGETKREAPAVASAAPQPGGDRVRGRAASLPV